ncbi:hypothetical protein [Pseudomonas fluorescens]|uniref:Uncharacterized protein n=1 Tax=Pseudomonas fluorescens TaxID=294 RepID=A0A0F4SYI3_PSEFL|nr:hypothetical protein [Pseudomonas fluorescens]KJZ37201.1 hypothetical protein VC34_26260 [Pseudomonas fluorescens]
MAFADILNNLGTGIGNLTATPLGQLGIQLLANSGYDPNNAGFGQRLGNSFQGMQQMQNQQALQQYRHDTIATEQQRQQQLQAQAQAKADQRARYQRALQDPNFLATLSPTARQFAALGIDPGELLRATSQDNTQQRFEASQVQQQQRMDQSQSQFEERMSHMGQGASGQPKVPAPHQIIEEPLPDGRVQKHIFDAATGTYKPYGAPFNPYSTRGAKADPLAALLNGGDGTDPTAPIPLTAPDPRLPGTGGLQSYVPQTSVPLVMGGATPQSSPAPNSMAGIAQALAPAANRSSGGPATPKTQADYDALPSGARYIDPSSGKTATKR